MSTPEGHISIDDASVGQLFNFAQVILNLEVDGRSTIETLKAKISAAGWSQDTIPDVAGVSTKIKVDNTQEMPVFHKEVGGQKRAFSRIQIHEDDNPNALKRVPVSVNGVAMLIERGKPQEVPVEFVEALLHAEEFIYTPSSDGIGEPRKVQSFPFSYV